VILDTSAIIAILFREPEVSQILMVIEKSDSRGVGAPTLVEAGAMLFVRCGGVGPELHRFIQELSVTVIPFGDPYWQDARLAYKRYTRGRHPAKPNFGDCLSYACAGLSRQPLLCKGNNFSQTDLELVPYRSVS